MKTFLVGSACLAALIVSGGARAADIYKAPPAPPPPVYSWTGFYAGLHGGVGWGEGWDSSASIFEFKDLASPKATHFDESGFVRDHQHAFVFGGGYVGYNFQINPFVLGFEADISGASDRRDSSVVIGAGSHRFQIDSEVGMDWFGTVRARAGYLVNPAWLLYATGGFAYGDVANDVTGTLYKGSLSACHANFVINCPTIFSSSDSGIETGWTIGGGTEFSLGSDGHWHAKFEYLYVDLGDSSGSFPVTTTQLVDKSGTNNDEFSTTSASWSRNNQFHTFKVGLSYQF